MAEKASLRLEEVLRRPSTRLNLAAAQLTEAAIRRGEGRFSSTGAFSTTTGKYTGRSPKDKFIVEDDITRDSVAWGPVNVPFSEERFQNIYKMVLDYLEQHDELFVFDGYVGADPQHQMSLRVVNQYAWQNLFARQLFIRPSRAALETHKPEFTVIAVPGLKAIPERDGTNSEAFVVVSFKEKVVLIGGTAYAGEIKKSIFSVMNYLLPAQGVLPMHCSANVGQDGRTALFFGLSGTGKTTLSADPKRQLVGDDEHGWSTRGIFNLEGGCYAKCINLSREHEPQIWDAIQFGSVLENVVLDPLDHIADYNDGSLTENTRCAYPLDYIPGRVDPSMAGHPKAVVFLTADAFGVLPPISILEDEQIMYHFISGYTSKLAGTERGIKQPEATFSACFGEPFLPLSPLAYAKMLKDRVNEYGAKVYLINTGWSGGPYGVGERISLKYTRQMVTMALSGELDDVETRVDPIFGFKVPARCPGIPEEILDPRQTWADKAAYDAKARELAQAFQENFKNKYADLAPEVRKAGPIAG
ncbi:MAG TPA: phosphoenolpyruvate carboxykinase (ATP) [Firmicutes bacterium]|jgi:phosphoenolpyruvate carboxykinase (ATP)|nr:phosphoenolpyruvate carboxykinase (ATP) [Bacillota bacterium]